MLQIQNVTIIHKKDLREIIKGTIISVSHDCKYIYEVCPEVYELDGNGLHKKA